MYLILVLLSLAYLVLLIWGTKLWLKGFDLQLEKDVSTAEKSYQELLKKKGDFDLKRMELESESLKIFALYEITKEITKSLHENEVFDIFKEKLKKYIPYKECFFVESYSESPAPDVFVFPLQGKEKILGFLVVKGIAQEDKNTVTILGSQFALALRRTRLYHEIEQVAITDSLTELYTRRYAIDRLYEEIKRSRIHKIKTSFLMIDVDFFKGVNDKYGHLTGDLVLKEVAGIIKENIREIDIGGRYGGEEFCVVLPDTDQSGAQFAAERIRQAAEKNSIKAYDANIKVTVSIGVSTFPEHGKTSDELIEKADWALYRAKKLGRNRVCVFSSVRNS